MSNFTKFEAFDRVSGTRKKYGLHEPLIWDIGARNSGWVLNVPVGMKFDISVPRVLEWALSPHDRRVLLAAAIHDELLVRGHDAAFASAEFRRAVIARGYPKPMAWILFITTLIWTASRHN